VTSPTVANMPSVSDYVQLDPMDATNIAEFLFALASLVDPDMEPAEGLTDKQRRMLTSPPGKAVTADPRKLAARLREHVAAIRAQLRDDAPEL